MKYDADRALRAGVERRENSRMPIGRQICSTCWKPASRSRAHREVAALAHLVVLGGDAVVPDPFLQSRDCFGMATFHLGVDRRQVGRCDGLCASHSAALDPTAPATKLRRVMLLTVV